MEYDRLVDDTAESAENGNSDPWPEMTPDMPDNDQSRESGAGDEPGDDQSRDDAIPDPSDDDSDGNVDPSDKDADKSKMELYDWLQCIISAVLCGIFIFVFFGRTIGVEGDSMLQTLHWYDRVIMWHLFYTPKNGDIIIFRSPDETFGGTPLVKRVIAVEGQTIDINFDTSEVMVDGVVLNEPYINEPTRNRIHFSGPLTVPEGHIFVMGDNRNNSSDSRDSRIGMVDTRYVLGKVLFIAIPGGTTQSPRDWSRFGPIPG